MGKKLTKVKNQIKEDLPKTRKGKIIGITLGVVTPIALGIVGGIVYAKFFVAKTVDYSDVDANSLYINMDNVLAKYVSTISLLSNFFLPLKNKKFSESLMNSSL